MAKAEKHVPFTRDMLHQGNVMNNMNVIAFNRVFVSLVTGVAIGLLGMEGWSGFIYYFLGHAALCIPLLMKAKMNTPAYFRDRSTLLLDQVFSSTCILTFILFWTLSHNFVYLF